MENEGVRIAELVADDDDDPDVDDVEDDFAQNVVHLELLDASFSGSLQFDRIWRSVDDLSWSHRTCTVICYCIRLCRPLTVYH